MESVQQLAGGHAGLVNVCGRFIQDKLGGSCDLATWQNSLPQLVQYVSEQPVYKVLLGSLESDTELMTLLRRLCLGGGVPSDSSGPSPSGRS